MTCPGFMSWSFSKVENRFHLSGCTIQLRNSAKIRIMVGSLKNWSLFRRCSLEIVEKRWTWLSDFIRCVVVEYLYRGALLFDDKVNILMLGSLNCNSFFCSSLCWLLRCWSPVYVQSRAYVLPPLIVRFF